MLGAQKFYGQHDLDNATYSFDCLRADAKVAHLRKGVNGATLLDRTLIFNLSVLIFLY